MDVAVKAKVEKLFGGSAGIPAAGCNDPQGWILQFLFNVVQLALNHYSGAKYNS